MKMKKLNTPILFLKKKTHKRKILKIKKIEQNLWKKRGKLILLKEKGKLWLN